MNLSAETNLRRVMETLGERIAPVLTEGFAVEVLRLAGLVLAISTNSIDDAAAIRATENETMRLLLGDAAGVVKDTALAARLSAAAAIAGSGLKISELDAAGDALRNLIIELHAHVETLEGCAARNIDQRIWRLLKDFEAARAPRR